MSDLVRFIVGVVLIGLLAGLALTSGTVTDRALRFNVPRFANYGRYEDDPERPLVGEVLAKPVGIIQTGVLENPIPLQLADTALTRERLDLLSERRVTQICIYRFEFRNWNYRWLFLFFFLALAAWFYAERWIHQQIRENEPDLSETYPAWPEEQPLPFVWWEWLSAWESWIVRQAGVDANRHLGQVNDLRDRLLIHGVTDDFRHMAGEAANLWKEASERQD